MIHDEEGAMAGVSAYHHNNTIFLFHLLASSSPHAITNLTTRGPLGRGYLLQARSKLPLDGGYYARHSHTASSRPASLPTPQSVPAQCTQTNHKIPIKVIHYLHYRSRRGDGRAVDHQTHTALGAMLLRVNYRTVTRLLIHRDLATMVVLRLA
jgi:hypothetical protein